MAGVSWRSEEEKDQETAAMTSGATGTPLGDLLSKRLECIGIRPNSGVMKPDKFRADTI